MKKQPTVVDVLKRMRAILIKRGWVQGWFAKSKSGKRVDTTSRLAVGFCLYGAQKVAVRELSANWRTGVKADEYVEGCIPMGEAVPTFNDAKGRKKSEVLAVVNCAIKKAEQQ